MPHDMPYRFRSDGRAEVSAPGLQFSFEKNGTTYSYEPGEAEYFFIMTEDETARLREQLQVQQIDPDLQITEHHLAIKKAMFIPTDENINSFIERVVNYYGLLVR